MNTDKVKGENGKEKIGAGVEESDDRGAAGSSRIGAGAILGGRYL
jgi:hypothetical protein